MLRHFYMWFWEDLGVEAPHPLRALLWVGAALLLSLVIWGLAIVWLAAA